MANDLTQLYPRILAQALLTLRENAIMPRLVTRAYSPTAGEKGSHVDVPLPPAVASRAVVPGPYDAETGDMTPTYISIPMDQWREAPFTLSDKEKLEVMNGFVPMAIGEAAKSLANDMDRYLLGMYKQIYGAVGTAGTTPFASGIDAAVDAGTLLHTQLAPPDGRNAVVNPAAQGNFLKQAPFRDVSQSANSERIVNGTMGRALGFDWFMDQNILTHTAGTAAALTVSSAGAAAGPTVTGGLTTVVPLQNASVTGTLVVGDIITFANHTQQYAVTAAVTVATTATNVTITPPLLVAQVSTNVVTKVATHVVNLAFTPNCIALATRQLEGTVDPGMGVIVTSLVDPITNISMRLEVKYQGRRTLYALDILYGAAAIRPQFGTRILG